MCGKVSVRNRWEQIEVLPRITQMMPVPGVMILAANIFTTTRTCTICTDSSYRAIADGPKGQGQVKEVVCFVHREYLIQLLRARLSSE